MSAKPMASVSENMGWDSGTGLLHIGILSGMPFESGEILKKVVRPCYSIVSSVNGEVEISFTGTVFDPDAIHVNVDDEIIGIAPKAAPVAGDLIVIEE